MNLVPIFSAVIALLSALPGAERALVALYADIEGHPDLTADEKAKLLSEKRAEVDAEDDRVQGVDVPSPAPTAPSSPKQGVE